VKDFFIKYWLEAIFTGVISALSLGYGKLKKRIKEQDVIKTALQALLRNEMLKLYNSYIEQEWLPIYELENINAMYEQYHALGGNGTITELIERLYELPTRPPR
jgi:hypothetical protein